MIYFLVTSTKNLMPFSSMDVDSSSLSEVSLETLLQPDATNQI